MKHRKQTVREETTNTLSHAVGVLFCLTVMPWVLTQVYRSHDLKTFYSVTAFTVGMFLVYSCSTLYHYVRREKTKNWLQIADHISIYFLIAGTYTPLMIRYLPPSTAFIFLTTMWSMVFLGTLFKIFFIGKFEWFSVVLYLTMGWMLIFVIKPLIQNIPIAIFWWILSGGVSYTVGVYFYIKSHKLYYHTIWHIFVLLGTLMHFIAIYKSI
ncbi:PAQR family membrane homeostasis protein TrhA [Flavobacterium sedimenticola]|uniref:Hemolysin III family protein n=1 Tax=Flavobacterium sedimenticola TaxID=3043286 RepID=A0ABT6XR66_9FLAO|nr:hemolysin III family protein [Flavobacterium sedimenticola]MDI9257149.1 hemolysin III family protein [Flavobacterium sedimenticola]